MANQLPPTHPTINRSMTITLSTIDESRTSGLHDLQPIPSEEQLKLILKLDDLYWREEIKDFIEDGYNWTQISNTFYYNNTSQNGTNDNSNKNNTNLRVLKIWNQFKHHQKCLYDGINMDTFIMKYPFLEYYESGTKDKHKNTPITPSSLFVPQFGYGTPSDSTSRARSTANSTSSAMFPYIPKTRARSSTTGSVAFSNSSYAPRFNLTFTTEPHTDEKKTDKTNDTGPRITAYFSPNISAQPLLSQTSDLNIGAAQLSKSPSLSAECYDQSGGSDKPPNSPPLNPIINIDIKLINEIKAKMIQLLQSKTKYQLQLESSNHACCLIADNYLPSLSTGIYGTYKIGYIEKYSICHKLRQLKLHCEPFKRITFVLGAYKKLHGINMFDAILIQDLYENQQLFDDFSHLKQMHIDADNQNYFNCAQVNAAKGICIYLESELKCDPGSCNGFSASYSDHKYINADLEYEDVVFQQQCHIIHSYFLHSTIKFGIVPNENNNKEEINSHRFRETRMKCRNYLSIFDTDIKKPKVKNHLNGVSIDTTKFDIISETDSKSEVPQKVNTSNYTTTYVGQREDELWWKDVETNNSINNSQSLNDVYRMLAKNMGAFRWQNPHGFAYGQNQDTMHLRPTYPNIKEEALQNEYEPLSKDNWNQALRKSTIFYNGWHRRKMQTKIQSFFEDQVTGQREEWNKGVSISKPEIVTLKLYTDYDKLQFALKKCFRFETFDDIFNMKKRTSTMDDNDDEYKDDIKENDNNSVTREELKHRLETFYHWRGALLITLNKYGTRFSGKNNIVLYHGINAKMIVKTAQTFAFSGPLSTTSSYHVARTFATAKGMILQITSQFPRLNYCNAFDVSLISDYPEEQEWLVGFMYVRLLKISTRQLIDDISDWKKLEERIPVSSWVRQQFFAIHLFDEQIFSMSKDLERILAQFLKVNRFECCKNKIELYKEQHKYYNDWDMNYMCSTFCQVAHQNNTEIEQKSDKKMYSKVKLVNEYKKYLVLQILWQKFNKFRKQPNYRQHVRFDRISDHLKRFFMVKTDEIDIETRKNIWSISFDEITTVYPNIEQIHFMNEYRFDDCVLNNLIKYIENNTHNTIKKIVFLYYNYDQTIPGNDLNMPLDHHIFKDPSTLNKDALDKLKTLNWKIKHNKNGETGYKIRIYNTNTGV